MQPAIILESDVLDIIFENRNKDYGAYVLRREYDNRVRNALLITFSFVALLLLLFEFTNVHKAATVIYTGGGIVLSNPRLIDVNMSPSAGPQKKSIVHHASAATRSDRHIIVNDQSFTKTIDPVKPTAGIAVNDSSNAGTDAKAQANVTGNGKGTNPTGTNPASNNEPVGPVLNPDISAQFPGGIKALGDFLKNNMDKPDIGTDEIVEVKAKFIVNADGSVSGLDIIKSGGDECDADVLKTLKKMPDWIPAKSKGHNVASYFVIPVKFSDDNP